MSIKAIKAHSADTDGFNKTIRFDVLHCSTVDGNNNKFYCIELQNNSSGEHRLFTHYGRLGKTNTYDTRFGELQDLEKEYERILKGKKRGKTVKNKDGNKVKEFYVEVDTFSPTVGSSNIRNVNHDVHSAAPVSNNGNDIVSMYKDKDVQRLIEVFYKENIHNIQNVTTLKMGSSGLETPLGPVTLEHVAKAEACLDTIKGYVTQSLPKDTTFTDTNNMYYSLIPHPWGTKIPQDAWIDDDPKLITEYDLLEQLKSAVTVGTQSNTGSKLQSLGVDIHPEEDKEEYKYIEDIYFKSRASNHKNAYNWKPKKIFKVNIHSVADRFKGNGAEMKPVYSLWHGSRNCNILSILINGLIIPPHNAGHVTGRMFGDGVYFAANSTKALNYSLGYWGGGGANKYKSSFLFVASVGMGRYHETKDSLYNGAPRGFDSVWAKASKGKLYNDEYIVYNLKQYNITHLVELEG